jgi:hypothetical protein
MQAKTTDLQAPPAPSTPKVSTTSALLGTAVPQAGVPTTAADVTALRAERAELSNQLESAAGRRASLSRQLIGKEGVDRAGIEARIAVLDKRMLQLESDIATTGQQLTMAPGALVASSQASDFYGMNPDTVGALGATFIVFVLAPLAFAAARLLWKRAKVPPVQPAITGDAARRLERLEQGMDAIAIERVSEGQRFVTRLLSESHGAPAVAALPRVAETVRGAADGTTSRTSGAPATTD